jgi:hypothetical protein
LKRPLIHLENKTFVIRANIETRIPRAKRIPIGIFSIASSNLVKCEVLVNNPIAIKQLET